MSMKHFCEKASRLMSDSFERKLSVRERLRVHFHIVLCHVCRRYQQQIHLLHGFCKRLSLDDAPDLVDKKLSPEDRERMQSAIKQAGADQDKSRDSS